MCFFLAQMFCTPLASFPCLVSHVRLSAVCDCLSFPEKLRMLLTTTPTIEGRPIREYLGIVTAETIIGANIVKDLFAGIRDIVGGRSGTYERVIEQARVNALQELEAKAAQMGADAVVGIDLDFETVGSGGSMLMVVASGTAVRL